MQYVIFRHDTHTLKCLKKPMFAREWNQARRKKFVAVNKNEKRVGDLKTALTSDMEMQSLAFAWLVSYIALGIAVQ